MAHRSRSTAHSALFVVASLLALAVLPREAHAHGHLKKSDPASGARLAAAPTLLRLEFSEKPELPFTSVYLVGAHGDTIALSAPRSAPDVAGAILVDVTGAMPAGGYTVHWQMAGRDGHPTHGTFGFTLLAGAVNSERAPDVTIPDSVKPAHAALADTTSNVASMRGVGGPMFVVVRWLNYVALLLVIGAVAFRQITLRVFARDPSPAIAELTARSASGAARFGAAAAIALFVVALLRLVAQYLTIHSALGQMDAERMERMVGLTYWGIGWLMQVILAAVAVAGFKRAKQGSEAGWSLASIAAIGLAWSPSLGGHAASLPVQASIAIVADGLHVLSAAGWLGSLTMLLLVALPKVPRVAESERAVVLARLVSSFTPGALTFASILALTGVIAARYQVVTLAALQHTEYGQTLLLKLALIAIVAVAGAYNWKRGGRNAQALQRSARIEIIVGALVLLVTAVLVALPAPVTAG